MIKLIASDVDGTLIPEGGSQLHPDFLKVIPQLKEKGITFVAASGRSYGSVLSLFKEMENEMYFIANNGAVIRYQGKPIKVYTISEEIAEKILAYFRKQNRKVFYLATTEKEEYTECNDPEMIDKLRNGYKVDLTLVEDMAELKNKHYVKMSIFFPDIDAMEMVGEARNICGENVSALVSGDHWIDFVSKEAEKGNALSEIQRMLDISREETMAFGDNYNDISLLLAAEESYAVSQAREEAKKAAKYVLADTTMETVLSEIRGLL